MVAEPVRLADYLATLAEEESDEVRFLRSVPWIVGTHRQDEAHILSGLRAEASRLDELAAGPTFSLITPLWNTPPRLLEELIVSVRCQSWLRWELVLVDDGSRETAHLDVAHSWTARDPRITLAIRPENGGISAARNDAISLSRGDFLAILDHDDLLHPLALSGFVRHLHGRSDANLVYSNEAKINEASDRVGFYLHKPPFDLATLLRVNYLCHFTAIRRDLMLAAARDGQVFRPHLDGVEDHDLFLRLALTGRVRPIHVPMCLYYWRMIATSTAQPGVSKPDLELRRRAMLEEHLGTLHPGAHWELRFPSPELGTQYPGLRIKALPAHPRPQLLVLIPFRDGADLTLRCLESLRAQQHTLALCVVLINNGSCDPATLPAVRDWIDRHGGTNFRVEDHDGAFNYARMHNRAIERQGRDQDLLLFLNNDVALVSSDALQTLAMHLLADRTCAFAGIRLEFPDGGIQHGGIKIHESHLTCGCYPFLHATEVTDYVNEERTVFGVTFACAMVRREVFENLGGLEEVLFPNSYGDVDIQARALALGYRNFYFGTLTGTHHESKTRRRVSEECELLALHERHAQVISDAKLRSFTLSLQSWSTAAAPEPEPVFPTPISAEDITPAIPLRYKLADRLNLVLKRLLGPVHSPLKRTLLRLRRLRQGRNRVKGELYRPNFRPDRGSRSEAVAASGTPATHT